MIVFFYLYNKIRILKNKIMSFSIFLFLLFFDPSNLWKGKKPYFIKNSFLLTIIKYFIILLKLLVILI